MSRPALICFALLAERYCTNLLYSSPSICLLFSPLFCSVFPFCLLLLNRVTRPACLPPPPLLEYLRLVLWHLTRMEFPFDRSGEREREILRSERFKGTQEKQRRIRDGTFRSRTKTNSIRSWHLRRLFGYQVQSTSTTVIGFINTIKVGRVMITKHCVTVLVKSLTYEDR